MAYFVWDGSSSTDGTVAANWSGGSAPPNDGTAVLTFNNASDAGNSFDLNSINGYSIAGIQILSTFTKYLINANTTSITLTGVEGGGPTNVAGIFAAIGGRMNINAALTFVFSNATLQSVDVTDIYYGVQFDSGQHSGSGDASIDSFFGMFFDQDSIDFTTFEFQISNKTLGLINGVYPNIKMNGTNTVLAPNNFNTIVIPNEGVGNFSNLDRVKMADLTLTGTDDKLHPVIVSSNFRKNAIDYEKVFEITGAISIASDTFDWGYSTLEITPKDADVTIPTSSETSYGPATSYFNPRYHRLIINDNSYVCFMTRDSVLTCHDLDVRGKLYAKDTSQTDETTASEIHVSGSVSITGDWNFQQISDGIYRSFGTKQKVNVAHGGTGQRFFADNSVILGNGKAALSSLAMGSADEVLKVNSGGTALEFGAVSGGGGAVSAVANGANNRVATFSSADALNGEANLTFDGSTLAVTGDLNVGSGDLFVDDSSGRVGIGTDSPDSILHVSSETSGDAIVIIEADSDNNNSDGSDNDTPQLWFKADGGINEGALRLNNNHLELISNVGALGSIKLMTGTTNNTGSTDPGTGASVRLQIAGSGAITFNNEYTFPTSDGSNGQVLTTNGSGTLSFTTVSGGGGSDTNTFVIFGEESDDFITTTAAAGNANGFQFSYGNGAQNTTKSSIGSDFGIVLPVACTLSRLDFTFGNKGSETNFSNQTFTVFKNLSSTTTTVTFNAGGTGGNAFKKSFASLSGTGVSYSAGDTFNLRTTGLSGYTLTQIGPARMTAYFTVA